VPKVKPGVKCFYCKGDGHWKCNYRKYLEDRKAGKVVAKEKGIFDIHVIDIYLTPARVAPHPPLSPSSDSVA
jgi:hypothetical protein